MNISEFKNIAKDCRDMNFRQIWGVYDSQFNELRDAILSLGDKIVVESFIGEKILHLEHSYRQCHCIVYLNNVIQWKDTDYEETDTQTITMLHTIEETDVIKVLIILNNAIVENIDQHVEEFISQRIDTIIENRLRDIIREEIENASKT